MHFPPFLIIVLMLPGGILGVMSFQHLSDLGRREVGKVLLMGVFADRVYYTEKGWKLRNASLLSTAVGFAVGVLLMAILG